jgi:hypothetical protein
MRRIFRRDSKIGNRHEIAYVVDIPLLSESLKSVIEEALRDCGKARYQKGTILTPTFVVAHAGLGYVGEAFWSTRTRPAFDDYEHSRRVMRGIGRSRDTRGQQQLFFRDRDRRERHFRAECDADVAPRWLTIGSGTFI